jgi:hypothetical protein
VSAVSVDDAFYVGASGSIHHSSASAFGDVEAGPVQVVFGWEAATRHALEVVQEASARGKGKAKAKAPSNSMQLDE